MSFLGSLASQYDGASNLSSQMLKDMQAIEHGTHAQKLAAIQDMEGLYNSGASRYGANAAGLKMFMDGFKALFKQAEAAAEGSASAVAFNLDKEIAKYLS